MNSLSDGHRGLLALDDVMEHITSLTFDGTPLKTACEDYGVTSEQYERWLISEYGGMTSAQVEKFNKLKMENRRLRALIVSFSSSSGIDIEV